VQLQLVAQVAWPQRRLVPQMVSHWPQRVAQLLA
jgi:hypothetical protein